MTVHERIKIEAERQKISISYITDHANLSAGTINKWTSTHIDETKGEPGANKLYKVASILDCSMEFLLTGEKKLKYDTLTPEESEWANLFKKIDLLSENEKLECINYIKGYIHAYCDIEERKTENIK